MDWRKREKRKDTWANIAVILTCLTPSALLVVGLIFPCTHILWIGLALTIVLLVVWAVPMAKQITRVRLPRGKE